MLEVLIRSGETPVVEACLNSPRLRESAIFQLLNSAGATPETISMVARHQRWGNRPNLRGAILKNRNTPEIWYSLWLPSFNSLELRNLVASHRLSPPRKLMVEQELRRRGQSAGIR